MPESGVRVPLLLLFFSLPALGAPRDRAVLVALDAELRSGEASGAGVFRPAAKNAPVGQFRFVRAAGELVEIATYAETPEPERCGQPVVMHPALELRFFVAARSLQSTVASPEKASFKDGSAVTVYPGAVLVPSDQPAPKGRASYAVRPVERLVEVVAIRPKVVTTVFTPRALPEAAGGALAGPLTVAVGGHTVELGDDEVLPLVRQQRKGGRLRVAVRGRCVVVETGVRNLLLGGLGGRGTALETPPRDTVDPGTKLFFFENGAPAGEVVKPAEPTATLPDGRRCFDAAVAIPAEHEPAKLRVCTAR